MAGLDWVIIGVYFALLLAVAWWVARRNRDTPDDYFLAGRNLGWFLVGASVFASNIGSEHVVGLAGAGATSGVALAHYELHAWCLLVLGWVFVPFYSRALVYTMPEFLGRRFSPTARWVLSVITLVAHVFTKFAVSIFAGGIVFATLLPEVSLPVGGATFNSFWIGSVAVVLLTGLYTVLGGMRAVAYTDAVQTFILVAGSGLLTVFGLAKLGGWHELRRVLDPDLFNLWKPLVPAGMQGTWAPVKESGRIAWYFNSNYPWLGMLFCAPIIGLWYWCTDQYIVQRVLGARDERTARRGSIFAAYLKLSPVLLFIIPGLIALALAKTGRAPGLSVMVDAQGNAIPQAAQAAFPLMVKDLLPAGLRGIVVAGLLAALMSSMAGAFNASSTLFTMDLYQKFRPQASQHQLVWVGRAATAAMVVISLLWIPVIQGARGLYDYLQGVQGYLAPPIFTVFVFGIFNKRLNSKGCLAALLAGFVLGVFRLAVDTPVSLHLAGFANGYAPSSFLWIVNNLYFQYYSLFIFIVSVVVMVVVSYATAPPAPPAPEQVAGLTYGTVTTKDRAQSRASWSGREVIASAVVLVLILAAYLYFRG
ncbi:MAG: Na+/glucose cotransporter [Gemmatimonadetes bacterium 13_1_40CM_3_65_8]|nr:MAG: Na+/glucose cotransporter [Gemmatimonadetes bacterium 13_1_40CM_4_65_7]OLD01774.1 MAG: Na+/glucose cotransporter [Gemmatimonadetes bacterium 13_1_40CM_3_65_8]